MAQEIQLIVELLREMKKTTNNNSENFERLLKGINEKFETVDPNGNTATLLTNCLCELAKNLDEKYSTTLSKFTDIEDTLNLLFEIQNEHVSDELKDLFLTFTDKMSKFHAEANQQKVTVSKLEEKIAKISDNDSQSQKEITKSINLLKSDFDELNQGYKKSIDSIYESLNAIITKIADEKVLNSNIKFDSIYKSTNEIINYISSIDRRDTNLEKLLTNLTTNESLKLTKGVLDSIVEKSDKISKKITNLASKSDLKNIKTSVDTLNDKLEEAANSSNFAELSETTKALTTQVDNIKHSLENITQNIDTLPDTKSLETKFAQLYHKLEDLDQSTDASEISENFREELENNFKNLTEEISTIKNLVSDLNETTTTKIENSINNISFEDLSYDIKNHISKMLSELPQTEDIERVLDYEEKIAKTTEQIEKLVTKTDILEEKIDNIDFDEELKNIYNRTVSIQDWLEESNIKTTNGEILTQLSEKANQKDTLQILAAVKDITENIEEISTNNNPEKLSSTMTEVYSIIEDLKNDFLNTTELHNDSLLASIAELKKSVEHIISVEDFNNLAEDLKAFVVEVVSSTAQTDTNIEQVKTLQNSILNKLDNINFESIEQVINQKNLIIENQLTNITQYIENLEKNNLDNITKNIAELKETLLNKKSNYEELEKEQASNITDLETYIQDIKAILNTKDNESDAILQNNFANLEEKLETYKTTSNDSFATVISKIDDLNLYIKTNDGICTGDLDNSLSEIREIKEQISSLSKSFEELNYAQESNKNSVSEFISEKLSELCNDLENITDNFDTKLQQGFAYSAELIEEKTNALLDFIKELRHNNSENIELYERLTVTDNKLMDFKQELELVNTDIVNNLNSKTEQIISDLIPIKETLSKILSNNINDDKNNELKEQLQNIHELIQEKSKECAQHSLSTYEKLDETYSKISNNISTSENNLRDFILADIDSVIIKIDNLKEDLELTLDKIAPPDADQMTEFKHFISEINSFKAEQDKKLTQVASDIKTYISEQMLAQHDEIKSLLKVSTNNRAILAAIENLKQTFKIKLQEYNNIPEDNKNDDFSTNEYEKEFEQNAYSKILEEIKTDFDLFANHIDELSDANPQIIEVLNSIRNKISSIELVKPEITDEITEDTSTDENSALNKFDIIRALDLLQEDVTRLHSKIEKLSIQNEKHKTISSTIPSLTKQNIEQTLDLASMATIKEEWLNEIKTYLANNQIQTLLDEINNKINVLTLSENSDWIKEVQTTLSELENLDITTFTKSNEQIQTSITEINTKLDNLAITDYSLDFDDIKFTLEAIDSKLNETTSAKNLSDSDAKITSMLETLNYKIDILAESSDAETLDEVKELILAQQDSIDNLEQNNKTEAFKKCLDELIEEVNNITGDNSKEIQRSLKEMKESIMAAVITIFEQVSFIEESEDIKDFVEEKTDEINKNLEAVTAQLKQITQADSDYNYSMQDIESDLAKLRIALNQLQTSEQDAKESRLNSILDNITQISSTIQGLQITSGESYNAINNFGKDITTYLSNKVDNVAKMVEQSHNSDKVMRQALIYMGEWIDSASESMNKISTNSEDIVDIKSAIEKLQETVPEQTDILSSIRNKIEEQEERIDRLEMSLEKILNAVEDIDDTRVTRKIDKLDKQLLKLSTNIEKLASYVD